MAVVAAGLAYAAARHTVKNNREQATADREQKEQRERKSQWWSQAEWAFDLVAKGDTEAALIGQKVLRGLAQSEVVDDYEIGIISVATTEALGASISEDLVEVDTVERSRLRRPRTRRSRFLRQKG